MQPEAASTFGKEKEALLVAPKQPEVPLVRTPIVSVSFDPYPSIRMPEKENSKKSRQGKSLQMGHLVRRIDPVYPEEAKQQGVEGAVKIHVVLSREGAVKSLTSMSGPPLLAPAAMSAVRQCRFSPTLLAGQAMETEEDVTVLFRLSSVPSKN
jgi:TonB family protein